MLSWQFNGFSLEREVREMLASNLPRIYWIINIKKWIKARRNLVAHSKAIESYDSSFFLARTTLKFESRHIHIPSTQQEPTRPNFLLPPFNPNRWRAKFSILFSQSSSPSSRGDKRSTRPSIAADLRSLWNRLSVEEVPVLTSVFDASIPLPGSKESRLRTRRSRISRNSRSSFQLALLSFFPPSTSEILPPSWRNLRKFWKED